MQLRRVINVRAENKMSKREKWLIFFSIVVGITLPLRIPGPDYIYRSATQATKAKLTAMAIGMAKKCGDSKITLDELLKENPAYGRRVDSWGKDIELRLDSNGQRKLISGGADQKIGTNDDIEVQIGNNCQ